MTVQSTAALWDAIVRWAIAVGGDPHAAPTADNLPRQEAFADIERIVGGLIAKGRIDDVFIADAMTHADAMTKKITQLREQLTRTRAFLLGTARRPELETGAVDLLDEAADIQRILTTPSKAP